MRRSLGLFAGIGAFFEGAAFVVGTPSLWGYALVPVLVALLLTTALGALGIVGAMHLAHAIVGDAAGALATLGGWIIAAVLAMVAVLIAVLVAFALAQPLSGFALEAIARRQAEALGAPPPPPAEGGFARSLRVTLTGLAFSLPLLALLAILTIIFPPIAIVTVPLKVLVSALTLAWDFLDYPLGQRNYGVRDRVRWLRANFGAALGFGVAGTLVLLVPRLGLLMLPMGVAGATRMTLAEGALARSGTLLARSDKHAVRTSD